MCVCVNMCVRMMMSGGGLHSGRYSTVVAGLTLRGCVNRFVRLDESIRGKNVHFVEFGKKDKKKCVWDL